MGERLLCKQDVIGSIPVSSTISLRHIEANLLEVEYPRCEVDSRKLILELVARAICLQRAPVARSSNEPLLQTIFDN